MIPINTDRIIRHELIGLRVCVIDSSNSMQIGIHGTVVDETKNMLLIFNGSKKSWIPKDGVTYRFILPNQSIMEIMGTDILGRPVERVKKAYKRRIR